MAKRDSGDVAEMVRPEAGNAARAKLVVPLGRGNTGKTIFVRWLAERAAKHGRPLALGDGDPTNATLAEYFLRRYVLPARTSRIDGIGSMAWSRSRSRPAIRWPWTSAAAI